jgi:hypothetical protein
MPKYVLNDRKANNTIILGIYEQEAHGRFKLKRSKALSYYSHIRHNIDFIICNGYVQYKLSADGSVDGK